MVCPEYPPMLGGIGRYTANLTRALLKLEQDMYVICDNKGNGNFIGISPNNPRNSEILLKTVDQLKPDIVHVQFDPGLFGLILDPNNPRKASTFIDEFYIKCRTNIVTTFHSGYITFSQLMNLSSLIKSTGRTGSLGTPVRLIQRFWKYYLNYHAINNLIKNKITLSRASIVFSQSVAKRLGNAKDASCQVIYHGSEPATAIAEEQPNIRKQKARQKFSISLNVEQKIALALGFRTEGKGWDLLKNITLPKEWSLVINSSKSEYNNENIELGWLTNASRNNIIVDLKRGYLSDEDLSILFFACDAVILPYKSTSGSGVMFDALAHGLPFVATDLEFFKEFSKQGLGIIVKRDSVKFSKAFEYLSRHYNEYFQSVNRFTQELKWNSIAQQHVRLYNNLASHY